MDSLIFFVIIINLLWLGGLTYYLYKMAVHYQKLVQGVKKDNLADILDKILEDLHDNRIHIAGLKKEIEQIATDGITHVQKVGLLRFNPFADTGGDQSFVLAILDGQDCGIVLTSLHNRRITRWYAKKVRNGKGTDHELSTEEEKAIKEAVLLKQERKGK